MTPRRPGALQRGWGAALAALFPARCVGCGRRGVTFCAACWDGLPRLQPPYCPRCSRPERGGTRCRDCQRAGPALQAVRAACAYSGAAGLAVRRLKYSRERHLVEPLATLLVECLAARPLTVDALVAVPLDDARARERGYNQAALLSAPVAQALGVALAPAWLRRTRPTRPQVGLSARERRANVRGAFTCPDRAAVAGRRVLVVDDVMTTGASLEACAEALMAAGAAGAWGLVVARDLPEPARPAPS
jgi:ComF family protein